MATSCNFKTSEASTKAYFRTEKLIDKYLKITNLAGFRKANTRWSNYAKDEYGIEGRLFSERQTPDYIQAVPNTDMFRQIDNAKGIFYQVAEPEIKEEVQQVSPEILQKLSDFKLFEDRDKLCASGICNGTARRSAEKLKEVGLNPFPSLTGSELSVTVKSPLGDFNITHYVAAVAIEDGIYIYDMPQNEFISDEFYGQGSSVTVKQAFEPRLIPLTSDEIMANYNLSYEESLKFIRSILNTEYYGARDLEDLRNYGEVSFKNYIIDNIQNGQEYINQLEQEIKDGGLLASSRLEYLAEQKEKEGDIEVPLSDKSNVEKILQKSEMKKTLTPDEVNRVSRLLETKLKLRTREYVPKTKERFVLSELVKNIFGEIGFNYNYSEGLNSVLYKFENFLKTDEFLERLWNNYVTAKETLDNTNNEINKVFNNRRLMLEFLKRAKVNGWKNALNQYSSYQRYQIQSMLSSRDADLSETQRITRLTYRYNNINNLIEGKTTIDDLFKRRFKAHKRVQKAKTILDFLKVAEFDTSYLARVVENEARRQYSYFHAMGQEYFQQEDNISPASPEIIRQMKTVAEKMGISIQKMSDYLKGNPEISSTGINALADLTRKTIAIAEGKEDVALTEEVVHIATTMIEQVNPKMITEMLSKIGNFDIYKRTLEQYKGNKNYQLSNGKPDIRKIKKEAVDKLITELIINENTGDEYFPELADEESRSLVRQWWGKLLDAIRALYKKAGIDVFREAAGVITRGEVENVELRDETFYQLSDAQKEFQKKIQDTKDTIEKEYSEEDVDPMFRDTEEASNWYVRRNANGEKVRVKNRVTDRVKAWYKQRFFGKKFTKEEKEFNELKRTLGVKYHGYFEEIHNRYFNSDGTRKANVQSRPFINDVIDREAYQKLENYYRELVDKFSKDGKTPLVFSEVIVYDDVNDEAGTLDLVIVEENGKANIFDWKFMSVSDKSEDIPWFKKGAFNIQLSRYKDILREKYGVKEIGMNRAIPILFEFKRDYKKKDAPTYLSGLVVGSVDATKIQNLKLLPVSESTESTSVSLEDKEEAEALDEMLQQLNAVFTQVGKTKATSEEEKEFKSQRLNILERAIRIARAKLDITPLIDVIKEMRKEGEMIINDYSLIFKDQAANSEKITDEQISEFSERMREYRHITDVFTSVSAILGDMIYTPEMEKKAKTKEEKEYVAFVKNIFYGVMDEERNIKKSSLAINKIYKEFGDKFIGQRNFETTLLDAEPEVKGIFSTFRAISDLPMTALRVLHRMVVNAKGKANRDSIKDTDRIMAIRKKLADRGEDLKQLVNQLYQKGEGNKLVNKLIYKYSKEFYDGIKNNALEINRDKKWLYDNIDIEGYKKEATELMNKNIAHYKSKYSGNISLMEEMIESEKQRWDITRKDFNGWDNYILRRHPQAKWYSKEYLELEKDPDLLELYNFITEINDRAKEAGYIQNKIASTFLPFVRKTTAESLAWDFGRSAIQNWGEALTINASTVGYGSVNELTNEIEHSIPKYYTTDFTTDEKGELDLSEDLFRNIILYTSHVNKYIYFSAIEGQVKHLKDIETFKGHLETSKTGDVMFENGKPKELGGNEVNAKMFEDFMRGVFYEEKYPLSDEDVAINTGVKEYMKRVINKVAGREIFTPNEDPSALSMMKMIDMANRGFQLKTLGGEVISGAVNAFGGTIQVMTQAGKYFKAGEYIANATKLTGNSFINNEEREMFVQLIDMFMPLKEDPNYERLKESGMTTLTRHNFGDMLMVFMRLPEQHIEKSIFLSLLQNTMIVDGKIVGIRDYVKSKYKDRYRSSQQYRESKSKIEEEIKELQKTKSIDATKKLVDGKLVIPGLDTSNSNELQRLTNLTRRISRNAIGGTSDSDRTRSSMNIWLNSMMVFKNWIPKLLATRFAHFEKVSDDFSVRIDEEGNSIGEMYDIGRIRLWFYIMGSSIKDHSMNVVNLLTMNEKGIELLDKMYVEFTTDYMKRTGKKMNMSKEDFNDLILNNLRNQMKELAMGLSMMSAGIAMGMMTPPDDTDKATKNFYRWSQKVIGKFEDELLFFYSPVQFQKMLSGGPNGGVFPALGLFTDITRFMDHFIMETTGFDISNPQLTPEEVREKAQPVKNFARMVPIAKSMMTYGAIFSSDFAKEFDITVQKQSR